MDVRLKIPLVVPHRLGVTQRCTLDKKSYEYNQQGKDFSLRAQDNTHWGKPYECKICGKTLVIPLPLGNT